MNNLIKKIKLSIKIMKFLILSYKTRKRLEQIIGQEEDKAQPNIEMIKERQEWAKEALKIMEIEPQIEFAEDFRLEENMVLICNHRSILDIILIENLIAKLHQKKSTFIAKKELKSIKFLGRLYELFGAIFIDRSNPRDFVKLLKQVKKIKNNFPKNNIFVIYPEGTRLRNKQIMEVGKFKEGFLKIAREANCNILPVFIEGGIESYFEECKKENNPIKIRVGSIINQKEATVNSVEEEYRKYFKIV